MHLTDSLIESLNLCEIGLPSCETHRTKSILESFKILVLVDDEESIESWGLQEDDLALCQVFVVLPQDLSDVDDVLLLLVSPDLRPDGLDPTSCVLVFVQLAFSCFLAADILLI